MIRYSFHSLARAVAEQRSKDSGIRHVARFELRWPNDPKPFVVCEAADDAPARRSRTT